MRRNSHNYNCYCDHCSEARNKRAHEYVRQTNQGSRYGESDEQYKNRVEKRCDQVEKQSRSSNGC